MSKTGYATYIESSNELEVMFSETLIGYHSTKILRSGDA
jgi:hypothetical protein